MADQVSGYPTSGLERFVTGFQTGYEKMTDMRKKSDDLKMQLASNEKLREAAKSQPKSGEGSDSTTTSEKAYQSGNTTGSEGGSSGGGSVSSFDPKETGAGHVAPKAERIEYYNQLAKEYGLNANAILMTIDKEGLHKYVGDNGKSFGDFQMYTAGGMGNQALDAGINIRDPGTWKEQAQFAMKQMAANKGNAAWFAGQWHGPRDHAPWAVNNFSNPDAAPPGSGARGMSAGSSAPVPGAPVQVGGPGSEGYGTTSPPAAAPAAAPPPAALSLAPVPSFSMDTPPPSAVDRLTPSAPPRMTGRPQQMSALGGPSGQPQQPQQQAALGPPGGPPQGAPPDIYNRPQAPPPPSVLAQLVGQYLPQQNAALAPRDPNTLYSGLV